MAYSGELRRQITFAVLKQEEAVSHVAQKYNVARKTIYKWIFLYKKARGAAKKTSLSSKYLRGANHPRSVRHRTKGLLIKFVTKNPSWGSRILSKRLKERGITLGNHGVWKLLLELNLSTKEKREEFAKNYAGPGRIAPTLREQVVAEIKAGLPITRAARRFNVARKTIYAWMAQLQATGGVEDQYVSGFSHPRALGPEVEKRILDLVTQNPALSSHKIAPVVGLSNHGAWNILKRNNLTLYEQRVAFAQGQAQAARVPVFGWLFDRVRLVWETFVPTVAPAPPPFGAGQAPQRMYRMVRPFLLSLVTSSLFSLGFIWWISLLASQPFGTSIGLFFATVALTLGSFFFAYSMKYYFTLAIVLSFSQQAGGIANSNQQIVNSNGKNGNGSAMQKGGFLSWILGLGNGGVKSRLGGTTPQGPVGLEPSLEHVVLKRKPFISIHIPFYNEKNVAERILAAVTAFDWANYEVIVVDDSTDETTQIIENYLRNHKSQITNHQGEGWTLEQGEIRPGVTLKHLHRTSRSGFKGGALAEALKHTDPRAEFVVVFDADFVPYPDTLELFLKYFKLQNNMSEDYKKTNVAVVQGYQWHVLNKSENWITRGIRSEYSGSYVIERSGQEILGALKMISGSVYMIRKDVLEEVGWETSITEDFQLTLKLYEKGYKVVYTPYIQAPAECVSTIQRLVRQRMRWAEGHSHNIRRMFTRLLFGHWETADVVNNQIPNPKSQINSKWRPSPLTLMEKLEFLYLSPYYLQAFFFLVGTLSWLISETIFAARLPFWTSLWGWSLVLTNFLCLPLMNAVGLFLEEGEEKDYQGIISFVILSYILVPFQAYAAIKGFLEREEGPWFRTPKTGRITDVFTRGRFYRFISGILPGRAPAVVQRIAYSGERLDLNTNLQDAKRSPLNAYLSLATANSRFDSFTIKPKLPGARWIGKVLVTVFLVISITLQYFSYSIPSYPDEVIANGNDFRWDQTPRLILDLKGARSLKQSILPRTNEVYAKGEEKVSTKVYYQGEEKDIPLEVKELESGKLEVALLSNESIKPGKYKVVATAERAGKDVTTSQDFTWGVLAINTDKSIYLSSEARAKEGLPSDKAKFSFAVLDDEGHMVCDAFLRLKIITSEGKPIYLSTEDGTIKVNPECELKGYTQTPDYEAEYRLGEAGTYEMELSALTGNGPRAIKDSFEVRDWVPFEIQRQAPTRIYPLASYPVNLKVKVNEDFRGEVVEPVPDSFEITNPKNQISNKFKIRNSNVQNKKEIIWEVDWKEGEAHELSYEFNAPIISPEFYLMGPLELADSNERLAFRETRQWQVASDSTAPSVQSVTGQTAGAVSSVTVSSVPGGTNQLYIAVGHFYASASLVPVGTNVISSISGGSLTWEKITGTTGSGDRVVATRTEMWWAYGSPATFNLVATLSATLTSTVGAHVAVARIDGALNAMPINGEYANTEGQNAVGDSTGTDTTTPSIIATVSNANSLILSPLHPRNNLISGITKDVDYTQEYGVQNISGGDASTIVLYSRANPSTGTDTIAHTLGATRPWVMSVAEIKVPEYSLIWLGLAPFLPLAINRLKRKREFR